MLCEGLLTPPLRFPIYRDPDTQMFLETYGQTRVRGLETLAQRGLRNPPRMTFDSHCNLVKIPVFT